MVFIFNINYFRLNFNIEFLEKSKLNEFKGSAIRGIIGEGLLENNCIKNDRNCENCICHEDCIVKNVLYKKYKADISFIGEKEGAVFTSICDDKKEVYMKDDELKFTIILFGSGSAYIKQIIKGIEVVGKAKGMEKNKYKLKWVKNYKNESIYENGKIENENIKKENLKEYIKKRLQIDDELEYINIMSNIRFKKNKKISDDLNEEDLIKLIKRRLIALNAFEGKLVEGFDEVEIKIKSKNINWNSSNRYSMRKKELLNTGGIKGILEIENLNYKAKELLIAGEVINVGKMTSMGLGNYILY
ncbi:MAG: CRISPR system precrRNA processing endoribonuclease RAMP protein Cas6 [Clostridium sp.]|uniref:CRISPR system precrRNA processing endoribonuclease RAMP protein Cas6 n=1 Tax=Clostridium sp. TaxID=1506 RepID=UPI003F33D3C0